MKGTISETCAVDVYREGKRQIGKSFTIEIDVGVQKRQKHQRETTMAGTGAYGVYKYRLGTEGQWR